MQDSKEKQCLIFVRNNANDTADRIEAYAKKSGIQVNGSLLKIRMSRLLTKRHLKRHRKE